MPKVRIEGPASPLEAAAVVAAVERFLRDHTPAPPARATDAWTRAARLESTHADGRQVGPAPWGDRDPWG